MVNTDKLKGAIVERGMSISKLALLIGKSSSTLYRKLKNNGKTITLSEADLIVKALSLTTSEAEKIFFN